jgi:hypothetical protein
MGILKNNKGSALPFACVVVMCLFLVLCPVMEYIRLTVIASGIRDALQTAVTSTVAANYDETYAGLREGYPGAYAKTPGKPWAERLDTVDIYSQLDGLLGLQSQGNMHVKTAGGKTEYSLYALSVNIVNAPLAPAGSGTTPANSFTADARLTARIPLSFGWDRLPPVTLTIKTKAGYSKKF